MELEGATHMTFVGQFRKPGHQSMLFQCAKLEAVAFWYAYLKADPAAKAYLASDALAHFSQGAARVDYEVASLHPAPAQAPGNWINCTPAASSAADNAACSRGPGT